MKIKVQLEDGDVVNDWSQFRDAFMRAAAELDMEITTIIHTDEELG